MKKLILLSAFSTALLIACRKETPVELPSGINVVNPTCDNGVMDGDEDGIDCGASTCVPCMLVHSIFCSNELVDNKLDADVITNFSPDEVTCSTASGKLIFTAQHDAYFFKVTFPTETPEAFREYECMDYANPLPEKVFVQYSNGSTVKNGYYGKVYLNRENGKYTVEVCDMYMGNPYIVVSGRMLSSN